MEITPGLNSSRNQSSDVAVPCPFTRFAISPTDSSLTILLSLARSASEFRTTVGSSKLPWYPFTDRILYRVTKISPARVASFLQSTNKSVTSPGPLERFCQDRIVYMSLATLAGLILVSRHTIHFYCFPPPPPHFYCFPPSSPPHLYCFSSSTTITILLFVLLHHHLLLLFSYQTGQKGETQAKIAKIRWWKNNSNVMKVVRGKQQKCGGSGGGGKTIEMWWRWWRRETIEMWWYIVSLF